MKRRNLLTFFLCAAFLSVCAQKMESGGVGFDITDEGELCVVALGIPYSGDVVIPDSVETEGAVYRVTAIAPRAFAGNRHLRSVRLPRSLRTIGDAAFASCTGLTYVHLPSSLETIGAAAFSGCGNILTMNVPASVTAIGSGAFAHCPRLASITVSAGSAHYASIAGILYDHDLTTLVACPGATDGTLKLSTEIAAVGDAAFAGCTALRQLQLPASLRVVGRASFFGCKNLSLIELPDSLQSIGPWAFADCEQLARILLPTSLTAIGSGAFLGCSALTEVQLPAAIETLGSNPFALCSALQAIHVEEGNARFLSDDGLLYDKERTRLLAIPGGKDGECHVAAGVEVLSSEAAMMSNGLRHLSLPASLTTIGNRALLGCSRLESVNVPHAVTSVGIEAFSGCPSLSDIICCGAPLAVPSFPAQLYTDAVLHVGQGAKERFASTVGWAGFRQMEEYGIGVSPASFVQGDQTELPVYVSGRVLTTSFQANLTLPQGLWPVTDEAGRPQVTLSGRNAQTHTALCMPTNAPDGHTFRLTVSSVDGQSLPPDSEVCRLLLRADGMAETGEKLLKTENVVLHIATDHLTAEARQEDGAWPVEVHDTAIGVLEGETAPSMPADVYTLQGIRVRSSRTSLSSLPPGVYVVNGRKVVKR